MIGTWINRAVVRSISTIWIVAFATICIADVRVGGPDQTPLMQAAEAGDILKIDALIGHGVPVDEGNALSVTALMWLQVQAKSKLRATCWRRGLTQTVALSLGIPHCTTRRVLVKLKPPARSSKGVRESMHGIIWRSRL